MAGRGRDDRFFLRGGDASDPAAAVSVGVPADVSVYWKLAVPAPAGIVSCEEGVKLPVLELLDKLRSRRCSRRLGSPANLRE